MLVHRSSWNVVKEAGTQFESGDQRAIDDGPVSEIVKSSTDTLRCPCNFCYDTEQDIGPLATQLPQGGIRLPWIICNESSAMTKAMSNVLPEANEMALPQFPVRKFTVQEYRRMGEAGVLSPGDQVELLEGWVVPKVIHNPPHDLALMLLEDQLRKHLAGDQLMRLQMPITTKDSEPEPDLVIVPGPIRSRINYTETSHLPLSFASDKNATIRVRDILP